MKTKDWFILKANADKTRARHAGANVQLFSKC